MKRQIRPVLPLTVFGTVTTRIGSTETVKCTLSKTRARYEEDITAIFKKANLEKSFFDVIVGANTTKKEKPHPDVFKYALRKLGVKPEETLFVGDHIDNDYIGARAVGIDALLIQRENRSPDSTSDIKRISSLEEIYEFMV